MEIIINMKGKQLNLKLKDDIFEIFYKEHKIGSIDSNKLVQALKEIERTYRFEDYNYEYRTHLVDEGKHKDIKF